MSSPLDQPHEVELKLELGDGEEDILRHVAVRRRSRGRAHTGPVRTVYWDTPDLALWRRGLVMRLRDAPQGRIQSVKTRGEVHAGLFDRTEVEIEIPGTEPDLAAVADPGLRAALTQETLLRGRELSPVVETEVRRTKKILGDDRGEVELAIDLGEVRTHAGAVPIRELELELVSGDPTLLYDVALDLSRDLALRPVTISKAERGFARLTGEVETPRRAQHLKLAPGASLDELIAAVVGECVDQIMANAAPAEAGEDPEGVHQLRIGVRRLRSALALLRGLIPAEPAERLRQELRWLGGELGPARDLDVFLAELLEPLLPLRPDDGALKRLRDEAIMARAEAYDRVRRAVRSPRHARLLLELGRWLASRGWRDQPLTPESARLFSDGSDQAQRIMARRHRKTRRRGRHLASRSVPELHALRIEVKKLRYAAEFMRAFFPDGSARRYARRLGELQDCLGHLNDVAGAERLLDDLLGRLGDEAGPDLHRAAGFVAGFSASGAERALERLGRRWRRFRKTPVFWPTHTG